jgi:hypothetical protein
MLHGPFQIAYNTLQSLPIQKPWLLHVLGKDANCDGKVWPGPHGNVQYRADGLAVRDIFHHDGLWPEKETLFKQPPKRYALA